MLFKICMVDLTIKPTASAIKCQEDVNYLDHIVSLGDFHVFIFDVVYRTPCLLHSIMKYTWVLWELHQSIAFSTLARFGGGSCTIYEYVKVCVAAWLLNSVPVPVPCSHRGLLITAFFCESISK